MTVRGGEGRARPGLEGHPASSKEGGTWSEAGSPAGRLPWSLRLPGGPGSQMWALWRISRVTVYENDFFFGSVKSQSVIGPGGVLL